MTSINSFSQEISFTEPHGHSSTESKLERYWKNSNGPVSLYRQRVVKYDTHAGITYSPMKYIMRRFELNTNLPDEDWVSQKLTEFIRVEFSSHAVIEIPKKWPPKVSETIFVNDQFLEKFLAINDSVEHINIEQNSGDSPRKMAENIFDLLCHPAIGSKKNKDNNNRDIFVEKIISTINNKSRLLFVIPGFPFKDQNLFRVPFDSRIPDMGEISFMLRLHKLTQALYQVHPFGTDVVVLSDGELYCEIFNIPKEDVLIYMSRLKAYRNQLNLQGTVSFLSLKELITRSSDDSHARNVVDHIKKIVKNLIEKKNTPIWNSFRVLVLGMKWNSESRLSLEHVEFCSSMKILRGDVSEVSDEYKNLWYEIEEKAFAAALEYASVNLMLKWIDLISLFFPESIRGTVHPKTGQFCLAGSQSAYAWNGVAWSKEWPLALEDIKILPFMSLSDFPSIKQVKFENSKLPCFYTLTNPQQNIYKAKFVLPPNGWEFDGIHGRELTILDHKSFVDLGVNDKFYSWEREIQHEKYFESLLQFRIKHYLNYKFGVHGIWIGETLIGQCGLQVLNEEADEVEFAIFIGNIYKHKGLGVKLTQYLITRCRCVEMSALYGVVRGDNPEGLNLVKKFGGIPIKVIEHFNQEAIVFRIKI